MVDGGIVNTRMYTGLILRQEQVRTAEQSGYINYYLPEGKRASVGSRIYKMCIRDSPMIACAGPDGVEIRPIRKTFLNNMLNFS